MDIWSSLVGTVTLRILTADPTATLAGLHTRSIPLHNVCVRDELTLELTVQRPYLKKVVSFLDKRGEEGKILARKGLFWSLSSSFARPVLLGGLIILCLLTVLLPTRILFFQVEGNEHIPTRQILELASQCGIHFGAQRREVRSEKVKNALLQAIPDLEWIGINTSGCVLTISVGERQNSEELTDSKGVSSIVAVRDGVIEEMTVTSGSPLCKPGQAVKAGQVLISGYTDCGLTIRAERARGEIFATTNHKLTLLSPENNTQRAYVTGQSKKYSMIIGKKRINFYQGSGNFDTSCVKMYEEKYVTLPGGFVLPIAIVTETCVSYDTSIRTGAMELQTDVLTSAAERYLRSQMVAGRILSQEDSVSQEDGVLRLDGNYACLEMIGREQSEEIIAP